MKPKKLKSMILPAIAVFAISSIALIGANAATSSLTESSLVEKIATKLNLSTTEVQSVIDEYQSEREAERTAQNSERLQTLVDEGKITAEQKTLIENKLTELEAQRETARDESLTEEERKTQMEAERTALKTWADENGIDMQYLLMGGKGGHGGPGGPHSNDTTTE